MAMFSSWRSLLISCALVFSVVVWSRAQAGLMIVFTGSTGNTEADAGFQRAADYIQSQFSDNITITIDRGFAVLGSGVLGQAGSFTQQFSYSAFRTAVANDVTSASDATYASRLPNASTYSMYTNRTQQNSNSATPYIYTPGSNTNSVELTTANARALGLTSYTGTDATITFSSAFTWDFDNSNGINANSQDFVGVATHELMHAMGFVSGVDDLNVSIAPSEATLRASALDFTRHSTESLNAGANIDFTADARAKFFSIDGGTTNLTPGASGGFSTGTRYGDGRQASHWKDNLGLGIMDPTANPPGSLNIVTALDLQALDVIGWNVTAVPEPSSVLLLGMASMVGGFCLRRRSRSVSEV